MSRHVLTAICTGILLVCSAPLFAIDVVKLRPQIRATPLTQTQPIIPIATIAPFLTKPIVANIDQLKNAAYVVGFSGEHLTTGKHDTVYVRQLATTSTGQFHIVRPDDPLQDPETGEILGYHAQFIAEAVLERTGDPASVNIVRSEREVAIGDRVIAAENTAPLTDFHQRPAPAGTTGRILSVLDGVSQLGQFDVVVLNRGSRDRVVPGHVFDAFVGGETLRDQARGNAYAPDWREESPATTTFWYGRDFERRGWENDPFPLHAVFERQSTEYVSPLKRAATLMVFRTFERVSFALVLKAEQTFRVGDHVAPAPAP